jgi:DNA-binding beta-propeller fold protein YncE
MQGIKGQKDRGTKGCTSAPRPLGPLAQLRGGLFAISWAGLAAVLLMACTGPKEPLPEGSGGPFGAGDTTYVRLSPIWDTGHLGTELSDPSDIVVSRDGYVYVADTGNDRILVLSRSGAVLGGCFDSLRVDSPQGVDLDSKLNLCIVNGTRTVYHWTPLYNLLGVFNSPVEPLYVDPDPDASFVGVAAGRYGSTSGEASLVYVTDAGTDRLLELAVSLDSTATGEKGYVVYSAVLSRTIARHGSGAGTVADPRGITTDSYSSIYFTLARNGGNFLAQKLDYATGLVAWSFDSDIMDLYQFNNPLDIALDESGHIFVADEGSREVKKFGTTGNLINLGDSGLAAESFNEPTSVWVDEDVLYVVDAGLHSILRYVPSYSETDIP